MLVHHFVKISPNHLVHHIFYHNKETLTTGGVSLRYKQYAIFEIAFLRVIGQKVCVTNPNKLENL